MSQRNRLSDDEKRELLRIARATLREYLRSGRIPPGKPHRDSLLAAAVTFVALRFGSGRRDCGGAAEVERPLYRAVQEMTVAALASEPLPLSADVVTIEVSVLDDVTLVRSPELIQIGRHGIIVTAGGRRGLLLPREAGEHGWDARASLEQACVRAGLPAPAWQSPETLVRTFTAETFDDLSHPPLRWGA